MGSKLSHTTGNAALQDVIYGSNLPFSSHGRDERVEVIPKTGTPYNWICRIIVENQQGVKYSASGFKIHLQPSIEKQVVLTSGHSLFIDEAYAKHVTLHFPGQRSVSVSTKNLWVPSEYVENQNPDYDFGIISLPGTSEGGFCWTTLLTDTELNGRPLSCCGYPSDKAKASLWITGGGVESLTNERIYYMQDSFGTSSGSAVYTWHKGYWTAIGIQSYNGNFNIESYNGNFNSAVRFNKDMIHRILEVVGYSLQYTIKSKAFPDVYLSANTSGDERSVTITCQPAGDNTQFLIIPLHMTSSKTEASKTVCISAVSCKTGYLHLNDTIQNAPSIKGDGSVSICGSRGPSCELYVHYYGDGTVAIESANTPGLYLHVDHSCVSTEQPDDISAGIVKCHLVEEKNSTSSMERFTLHKCN